MTSPWHHELPYDTHPIAATSHGEFRVWTPSSFGGVTANVTHARTHRILVFSTEFMLWYFGVHNSQCISLCIIFAYSTPMTLKKQLKVRRKRAMLSTPSFSNVGSSSLLPHEVEKANRQNLNFSAEQIEMLKTQLRQHVQVCHFSTRYMSADVL